MITKTRLKELLHYDQETGTFTWLESRGRTAKAGNVAGSHSSNGYTHIKVDGREYLAHRLAWLYVYGRWPVDELDHKNGVRDDNRIENLREATGQQNKQNQRRPSSNNTSGYLGVTWYKRDSKWLAQIRIDGRKRHLGCFHTAQEASEAYLQAKRELHEFSTI